MDATHTAIDLPAIPTSDAESGFEKIQPGGHSGPVLGAWYWLTVDEREWVWDRDEDGDATDGKYVKTGEHEVLVCCMAVGSNYVKVESVGSGEASSGSSWRVHINNFWTRLRHEPSADSVIRGQIAERSQQVQLLLAKVEDVTARIGMAPQQRLGAPAAPSGSALVVMSATPDIAGYKTALVRAKDEELPQLFKELRTVNADLAHWMKAPAMTLLAQVGDLKDYVHEIDGRIFSISLYAGLTESAVQVAEGAPAEVDARLHVMQRMLFMDEESLLGYRHGGMSFREIRDFDIFIAVPENRDRILPFPRTLVALRVRRSRKERQWDGSFGGALELVRMEIEDTSTFFYVRNGEQIWRIGCEMDFPELIFPTREEFNPLEPKMFKKHGFDQGSFMAVTEFEDRVAEEKRRKAGLLAWRKAYRKEHGRSANFIHEPSELREDHSFRSSDWELLSPDSVYYDDGMRVLDEKAKEYNRISLIIQGLFDRSMVLHPHLPVKTWTREGFERAIALVSDGSDVLHYGEAPDFEEYRARCNKTIGVGSVVIGQQDFWQRKMADRENARQERDTRRRGGVLNYRRYKPHGNPGPAEPAPVQELTRTAVKFRWSRSRQTPRRWRSDPTHFDDSILVPIRELFNVSAYQLGDFKQFFQDPRTRAKYLQWAPMLLAAEEYIAAQRQGAK